MSSSFPNGTVFAISTAKAAADAITAISNANPGVVTAASHGIADGSIVLLSVASTRLDNKPVRTASADVNTFALEGIDTTSTTLYPTGFGVGSAVVVSSFVPMSQVTDTATSGGEPNFFNWVYLEDGKQRQRPTFTNARSMQVTLDYDPSLAWHGALIEAATAGDVRVLRATLPTGALIYWGVYVAYDGEPSFNINTNQQVVLTFSMTSTHTRYAS